MFSQVTFGERETQLHAQSGRTERGRTSGPLLGEYTGERVCEMERVRERVCEMERERVSFRARRSRRPREGAAVAGAGSPSRGDVSSLASAPFAFTL